MPEPGGGGAAVLGREGRRREGARPRAPPHRRDSLGRDRVPLARGRVQGGGDSPPERENLHQHVWIEESLITVSQYLTHE